MKDTSLDKDESALVRRFRAGQEAAFTEVYNSVYERLYWYGLRFIREESEVEDMISEAWISAWKRRESFGDLESISAYLHVAVRNQCYTLLKHRQMKADRELEILNLLEERQPGDFSIEDLQVELLRRIFEQVNQLSPKMKEVFLLSFEQGLKPAEIAEKLGVNVQTVKNRKVTALKVLKAAISNEPLLVAILALLGNR